MCSWTAVAQLRAAGSVVLHIHHLRECLDTDARAGGLLFQPGEAELWAENDDKYLIYDDTSVQADGFASDDEDGISKYASSHRR